MRQARIKSDNQLVVFSDSICQYYSNIGFYKYGPSDHCTHVPVTVSPYNAESEYNSSCTTEMALAHFIILNNSLMNKYTYLVPEQEPLFILGIKSYVCVANNGNKTKHTRQIFRRMHF